jgi:2-polyprenyl-6-methoxyphenol hydroxylase-like FAD-dependent oxidoreductase
MKNKRILISGGGIAGLTLAYWLKEHGFEPTIVEIGNDLRAGGYMIDFWGVGYTVAERMGILQQLEDEQNKYKINEIKFVDENSKRIGGLKTTKIRELVNQRYFNLLRSSLEKVLSETVKEVDILFSTSITEIKQNAEGVQVVFNNGNSETFDLLIGAEGLRSNTRRLVFGPDKDYELFLNYYTAAYTIDNFTGKNDLFLSYSEPEKQVGIYDVGDNKLATFYIYSSKEYLGRIRTAEKKEKLLSAFNSVGWYTPELLKRIETAPDFYFDTVSQIELPVWHKDRIALVGDAAQAVSLISGQGSSLAMAAAYVLAGELKEHQGDYQKAFASYQNLMKPEIERKQKSARSFADSFVPSSKFGIYMRNLFTNLMSVPLVSNYLVKMFISDKLNMKKY